tara:strand:+ start:1832 stop:2479 length:648 start_codon:yes stop_codon:yes gene_type:complete
MATRKITAKVIKEASGTHTGRDGDLLFDDSTNKLAISDGTTAGGVKLKETSVVHAAPTGHIGFTNTAKVQMANSFSAVLVKNTCYLGPANGAAITATLPTAATSEIGDVIKVQYNTIIANGATHKYGTATEFFEGGSTVYKMTGATGSAVGLIMSADVADGTGDDFLNLVGLTNAGPGIGTEVIFSFNGSAWWAEARCTSSGTGIAANLSVFATS